MRTQRSENISDGYVTCGDWRVGYNLKDGGRLTSLAYKGQGLLTPAPHPFHPPAKAHGLFEDRPVYGYDDCFPSVVACYYPGKRVSIPDHGELCWLPWEVSEGKDSLAFVARSKLLPLVFKREMTFYDSKLVWDFEVTNKGSEDLPFQHSMHPLLPVDEIEGIQLPGFKSVFDWNANRELESMTPAELCERLLTSRSGAVEMLFVRRIENGEIGWTYSNGLSVRMLFPHEYFPTIGIWWDRGGYPDEVGISRNECAFEPTAGSTSLLSQASADGECLTVHAGSTFRWQIVWEMSFKQT